MVTGDRTRIGKRLLVARIEAGIESADMMGRLIGRTGRQARNYERGLSPIPAEILQRWADATGKPVAWFLETETPAPAGGPSADGDAPTTHPGVLALAANVDLCRSNRVTPEELQILSGIVSRLHTGEYLVIQDAQDALRWLSVIRNR